MEHLPTIFEIDLSQLAIPELQVLAEDAAFLDGLSTIDRLIFDRVCREAVVKELRAMSADRLHALATDRRTTSPAYARELERRATRYVDGKMHRLRKGETAH